MKTKGIKLFILVEKELEDVFNIILLLFYDIMTIIRYKKWQQQSRVLYDRTHGKLYYQEKKVFFSLFVQSELRAQQDYL